jgi:hypothetical protein
MIIVLGLACGGTSAYLLARAGILRRRDRCPACGDRRLTFVSLTRGAIWPPAQRPADTSLHRCEACGLELCRAGDGPLIPRAAWDAGQRDAVALPTATVVHE